MCIIIFFYFLHQDNKITQIPKITSGHGTIALHFVFISGVQRASITMYLFIEGSAVKIGVLNMFNYQGTEADCHGVFVQATGHQTDDGFLTGDEQGSLI